MLGALSCGVFALGATLARRQGQPASIWLTGYVLAYLAGGWKGLLEALDALRRGELNVDFLMILAALGAASIGGWGEGSVLLFLFSLSNALQHFALERTRHAIRSLFQLRPDQASVVRDGAEVRVAVEALRPGDRVRVRPGERLGADGEVLEGESDLDESALTGESMPITKMRGAKVYAGTINGSGSLLYEVTGDAGKSRLARIIELVERAQAERAPTQQFIDKFGQRYAIAVVLGVALWLLVAPLLLHWPWHQAFYRAMVALVVASPCALVISTPATILAGIAAGARRGILFKGGGHLEEVGKVRAVAFDKTGTLTRGKLVVTDVVPAPGVDREQLLKDAAAAEHFSEHPVARAIVQMAGPGLPEASDGVAVPGRGLEATVGTRRVRVGTSAFMVQSGVEIPSEVAAEKLRLEGEGKTVVLVADSRALGVIAVADEVRAESASVVQRLHAMGVVYQTILTGDHERAGRNVAELVGLDDVHAQLMPEDKVRVLQELRAKYGTVAMVGDGVNDAPALVTASVGIAMGSRGTDVALETADVVLMQDSLERLPELIQLGRRAARVVRQNVWISVGVMAVLVSLNLLGRITLPLGVVGHEGSTLVVVLNGLRLLRLPKGARP